MTIDPFVLLTPILILAIMALVRFVGCLDKPAPPAPTLNSAVPGDQIVVLTWDPLQIDGNYIIKRGTAQGGPYSDVATVLPTDSSHMDTGLTNGIEFFYVMVWHIDGSTGKNSNEVSATPQASVTVTFGNDALGGPPPGAPGSPLVGLYKNLDFGTGAWFWVDPALGMGPANAININSGPNPGSGDIAFVNGPRYLERIRVFPKRVGNVNITDSSPSPQNPQVAIAYQTADLNMVHFIETGWTFTTQKFTIQADIGFDLDIDTIIYTGPP